VDDLAKIAAETGQLAHHHLGRRVRVALLSHTNEGRSRTESSQRVQAATASAKNLVSFEDVEIDGGLQLDVALDPEVAGIKVPHMAMKERADVLVFPSLDSAHISLQLLRHVGGANAYGRIIRGLTRPAGQVPRTATEEMILGTAAALGVEAIQYRLLYPKG
jgi:phosphotransacetylase